MITLGFKYTNHSYFLNMGICSRPRSGSTSGMVIHSLFAEDFSQSSGGCQLNRQMRQDMARMELAQLEYLELRSSQSFTSNSFRAYKTI